MTETEPQILDTCETLHGVFTGSHMMSREDADYLYHWLRGRVANWKPATERSRLYDSIVYTLALKALAEYQDWWQRIGAPAVSR